MNKEIAGVVSGVAAAFDAAGCQCTIAHIHSGCPIHGRLPPEVIEEYNRLHGTVRNEAGHDPLKCKDGSHEDCFRAQLATLEDRDDRNSTGVGSNGEFPGDDD